MQYSVKGNTIKTGINGVFRLGIGLSTFKVTDQMSLVLPGTSSPNKSVPNFGP